MPAVLLVIAIGIAAIFGRGETLLLLMAIGVLLLGRWLWRALFARTAANHDHPLAAPTTSAPDTDPSAPRIPAARNVPGIFLYVLLTLVLFVMLSLMMGIGAAAFLSIPLALLFGKVAEYSGENRKSEEQSQPEDRSAEEVNSQKAGSHEQNSNRHSGGEWP